MREEELVRRLSALERKLDSQVKPELYKPWQDWTPTLTQGVAVSVNITFARYAIVGDTIHIDMLLAATSAGTGGQAIEIGGIPSLIQPAASYGSSIIPVGNCCVVDQGTAIYYGFVVFPSVTAIRLRDSNTRNEIGVNPNFALANTDIISISGVAYEWA